MSKYTVVFGSTEKTFWRIVIYGMKSCTEFVYTKVMTCKRGSSITPKTAVVTTPKVTTPIFSPSRHNSKIKSLIVGTSPNNFIPPNYSLFMPAWHGMVKLYF